MDMLNAVKRVLANVSSDIPSSEQRALFSDEGLTLETLANTTLYGVQHIHINLTLIHSTFYRYANADQNYISQGLVFDGILCSLRCSVLLLHPYLLFSSSTYMSL